MKDHRVQEQVKIQAREWTKMNLTKYNTKPEFMVLLAAYLCHQGEQNVVKTKGDQDYGSPVGPEAGENQTESISKEEETTGSSGKKSHRRQIRTRGKRI